MQRLHEDDLVGHVLGLEPWKVIRFPAIAQEDETHVIRAPYGTRRFERRAGEALHPEREPLETLGHIREALPNTISPANTCKLQRPWAED
jgi:hypothetical protein